MARIAGVNLPTNKRVVIALQAIHGIGGKIAKDIVTKVNLPAERRVSQLTDAEVLHLREMIACDYMVEIDQLANCSTSASVSCDTRRSAGRLTLVTMSLAILGPMPWTY